MSEITREEKYLAKLGGAEIEVPEPITRKEKFLAKATGATVEVPEPITREEMYLSKINGGGGGYPEPTGSVTITANGTHNVKDKATAVVNVPNPSTGELSITQNGNYDVTDYASADVDVPNPSTGSISITENGNYDVTEYASANVNVSGGGSSLNPITDARYLFFQNARVENFDVLISALGQTVACPNMFNAATNIPWIKDDTLSIPENVLRLGENPQISSLFTGITTMKFVSGMENIIYTGSPSSIASMFAGCNQLEDITIPFDLYQTTSMMSLFSRCSNLKRISFMGRNPRVIATTNLNTGYLFANCTSLESVTINGTNGALIITSANAFDGVPATCKFYVPSNLVYTYKHATNWSTIADQIFAIE